MVVVLLAVLPLLPCGCGTTDEAAWGVPEIHALSSKAQQGYVYVYIYIYVYINLHACIHTYICEYTQNLEIHAS